MSQTPRGWKSAARLSFITTCKIMPSPSRSRLIGDILSLKLLSLAIIWDGEREMICPMTILSFAHVIISHRHQGSRSATACVCAGFCLAPPQHSGNHQQILRSFPFLLSSQPPRFATPNPNIPSHSLAPKLSCLSCRSNTCSCRPHHHQPRQYATHCLSPYS